MCHHGSWSPFYRRYGRNLPSSFSMVISTPESVRLVHQCRFRVRLHRAAPAFPGNAPPAHPIPWGRVGEVAPSRRPCLHRARLLSLPLEPESLCVENRSAETLERAALLIVTGVVVTHVSILTSESSIGFPKPTSLAYRTLRYHGVSCVGNQVQPRVIVSAPSLD